ncbi:translation initiation factor IF-1 [bacterium]|jgi:translation initiation factor IF-1|nr:translation initiation factor IF-1 [bacterium]
MAKNSDLLELEGEIVKVLPNNTFKVLVQDKHEIVCYTSGKMRQFKIKMIVGDTVKVEISPYDLSKGRITFRL